LETSILYPVGNHNPACSETTKHFLNMLSLFLDPWTRQNLS
jgi:hypothetical protein